MVEERMRSKLCLLHCTNYPTWNVLSLLSLPSFLYVRRTWWDGVKEDVGRGRVKGELADQTQVHLEGWLLNQRMCVSTNAPRGWRQ